MITLLLTLLMSVTAQAQKIGSITSHAAFGFPSFTVQANQTTVKYGGHSSQGGLDVTLAGGKAVSVAFGGLGELLSLDNTANSGTRSETVKGFGFGLNLSLRMHKLSVDLQYMLHKLEHYQVGNFSDYNTYNIAMPKINVGYSLGSARQFSINYSFMSASVPASDSGYNYDMNWSGSTIWVMYRVKSSNTIFDIFK